MRPLTNDERRLMRHALGLDNGTVAYRNRYISNGRHEKWEALCACGAANRNSFSEEKHWTYWVTESGWRAVSEPGDQLQPDTVFIHAN